MNFEASAAWVSTPSLSSLRQSARTYAKCRSLERSFSRANDGARQRTYLRGCQKMTDFNRPLQGGDSELRTRIHRMLTSYLLNCKRGPEFVRTMICDDIHRFTELGAKRYVAELIEVLKQYDSAGLKC